MLKQTLKKIFRRDLEKLKQEIDLYHDEKKLWIVEKNISNSAGNLCLHLIGNINAYIGAEIGKTGYIRHRDLEFSEKDLPKSELLQKIDDTIIVVENALNILTNENFNEEYPLVVFDKPMTTEYFLVHLAGHLNYHLGQINYHRRLLDSEK
ncbi:MAG: DUF1572 family protein [Pyrinomonadaceae bacterium]